MLIHLDAKTVRQSRKHLQEYFIMLPHCGIKPTLMRKCKKSRGEWFRANETSQKTTILNSYMVFQAVFLLKGICGEEKRGVFIL